jgi:hypothetical protein
MSAGSDLDFVGAIQRQQDQPDRLDEDWADAPAVIRLEQPAQ